MLEDNLDTIDRNSKVILYPSSCRYSNDFQDVDYDVVILNSNEIPRMEVRGKVYCLNFDNNELLGSLYAKGIRLSAVIIIRDGCVEGGNYECAAKEGFFGRLMPVMADNFDYFCDHWSPLDVPASIDEFETPSYLGPFIRHSNPINDVKAFHVKAVPAINKDFFLGKTRVRIIRDSIWKDHKKSDLLVIKKIGSSSIAIPYYLAGLSSNDDMAGKIAIVTQSRTTSISHLLQRAASEKLSRLSLLPIAGGSYARIAEEIQKWKEEHPKEICFYHLNADDYTYLKSL